MTRTRFLASIVILCPSLALGTAHADMVVLKNGDRLSGSAVAMAGGVLVFKTAYAGELKIPWGEVDAIATEEPVEVLFEGEGAPVRTRLAPGMDLAGVAYLNPQPHESGRGVTYTGRATLSAAYARGNARSDRLYGDAELLARARKYRYQVSGKIEERRAETDPEDVTAWRIGGNYDRFVQEDRFVYLRGSLERDQARELDRRAALGAGYGAELLDTPRANITARGGLDYVTEERDVGEDRAYPALGWGLKALYKPVRSPIELFHEQEGFRNLEESGVVVRSKQGLRVPFTAAISGTAQLNVDWESRPAAGRESTDTTLLFGVNYAW